MPLTKTTMAHITETDHYLLQPQKNKFTQKTKILLFQKYREHFLSNKVILCEKIANSYLEKNPGRFLLKL